MPKIIKLSPSTLNIFVNCPRCFWLLMNKNIRRPRGIFPSLPSGMDAVIKDYFDKHRRNGLLPPELEGKVRGKLLGDFSLLNKWRDWRSTDLKYRDDALGVELSGALDDCIVEDNLYSPLDYKTRGFAVKEDPRKYYQLQLDCYCLMLKSKGYKLKGLAYLVYYYPKKVSENGLVSFNIEVFEVTTNPENALKVIKDALNTLCGTIPKSAVNCEYCGLVQARCQENYSLFG
ncbi:MAG: PD-(D/E)XK nuclease family protein [Candidatus Omnitrophota bacterium]